MQQQTFAEVPFEQYRKPTHRERFLDEMNRVVRILPTYSLPIFLVGRTRN